MKSSMKCIFFLILGTWLMQLTAIAALAAASPPASANWNRLKQLTPRDQIRVVLKNLKSYTGDFESLSDDAITVRSGKRSQSLARQDVLRIATKGKSHRLRNTLIGAAIGAGTGLGFGAAVDGVDSCRFICFSHPNDGLKVFTPSFAVIGAVVGASLPAHKWRWRDLYRAP